MEKEIEKWEKGKNTDYYRRETINKENAVKSQRHVIK